MQANKATVRALRSTRSGVRKIARRKRKWDARQRNSEENYNTSVVYEFRERRHTKSIKDQAREDKENNKLKETT